MEDCSWSIIDGNTLLLNLEKVTRVNFLGINIPHKKNAIPGCNAILGGGGGGGSYCIIFSNTW